MPDVKISLGAAGQRAGALLHLGAGEVVTLPGPEFYENLATFDVEDYVVIDGAPVADSIGANFATRTGLSTYTQVTTPLDPAKLFPESFAHWTPGLAYMAWNANNTLYRWWPVQTNATRLDTDQRMSLFKQTRESDPGGLGTGMKPYGDGVGAPYTDESYTYQGFGRSMTRKAMVMESRGFMKIDPEASFTSGTLAITAVMHPSDLPYYGLFEAAQETDTSTNTLIGDPFVLRWHHGQLRVYHAKNLVLAHEAHRGAATPLIMVVSLDSASGVGRFYVMDANRTTRTFNIEGMKFVSLLGIFGGLGQGVEGNPYNWTASMEVLDVTIWNYAMDWPELESKVNRLALAFGAVA